MNTIRDKATTRAMRRSVATSTIATLALASLAARDAYIPSHNINYQEQLRANQLGEQAAASFVIAILQ